MMDKKTTGKRVRRRGSTRERVVWKDNRWDRKIRMINKGGKKKRSEIQWRIARGKGYEKREK